MLDKCTLLCVKDMSYSYMFYVFLNAHSEASFLSRLFIYFFLVVLNFNNLQNVVSFARYISLPFYSFYHCKLLPLIFRLRHRKDKPFTPSPLPPAQKKERKVWKILISCVKNHVFNLQHYNSVA